MGTVLCYDKILEKTDVLCRENDNILFNIIGVDIDKGSTRLSVGISQEGDLGIKDFLGLMEKPAD